MGYKKEDIPLFEDANKGVNEYREDDIDEDPFRGYGNNYLDHLEEEEEEMQGYGSSMVQEEVEYDEYREREEARAAALHNYYKQLRGHQSGCGKSKLINTSGSFQIVSITLANMVMSITSKWTGVLDLNSRSQLTHS